MNPSGKTVKPKSAVIRTVFYKVKDAECDFCKKKYQVVTQANYIYVCVKCAKELFKHAQANERTINNLKGI